MGEVWDVAGGEEVVLGEAGDAQLLDGAVAVGEGVDGVRGEVAALRGAVGGAGAAEDGGGPFPFLRHDLVLAWIGRLAQVVLGLVKESNDADFPMDLVCEAVHSSHKFPMVLFSSFCSLDTG